MRFTIYAPTEMLSRGTSVEGRGQDKDLAVSRLKSEGHRWKRLGILREGRDTGLKSGVNENVDGIGGVKFLNEATCRRGQSGGVPPHSKTVRPEAERYNDAKHWRFTGYAVNHWSVNSRTVFADGHHEDEKEMRRGFRFEPGAVWR